MSPRSLLLLAAMLALAACADGTAVPGSPPPSSSPAVHTRMAARERLTRALATALADSSVRAAVQRRLAASNQREGKVQFQALLHADQQTLLLDIARRSASSPADLLADLDAARGLELYLPVAAQRAAWRGDADLLVATVDRDGDPPVAYDVAGTRRVLDPRMPPATPVLALVPQETDFTGGRPERLLSCVDMCDTTISGTGSPPPGKVTQPGVTAGLYLVQSHFTDSFESWLKGDPEYEYHVYGLDDNGQTTELSCTGEHAGGANAWDQNKLDWTGSALLFSDQQATAYQAKHPNSPIRIMAWEDDDEACVDHADVSGVSALVTAVDNAYKSVTSGKLDPLYIRGIRAAPSIFSILTALHNIILTNDDFIGNGVEGSVTHDAPGGANWVLKSSGTVTTGWFTTAHKP